jgi:hypothetical protein
MVDKALRDAADDDAPHGTEPATPHDQEHGIQLRAEIQDGVHRPSPHEMSLRDLAAGIFYPLELFGEKF